jgi:DNA-binding CsgD family transcriptional regulator
MADDHLRPFERRVLELAEAGEGADEIGRRFNRSPDHIERVIELAQLPHRGVDDVRGGLRPIERRVLRLADEGQSYDEIGQRLHRSPEHVERVAGLARYKLAAGAGS